MALALLTTTAFEKDLRRAEKQGRNLDKLERLATFSRPRKSYQCVAGLIG